MRYAHLHVQGATLSLTVEGHSAMLTWHVHQASGEAIDHVADAAVATLHNVVRRLCSPDWRPTEVWFPHRRPADVGPFRRFFRVPLRFDAEQAALLFSAGYLKHRLHAVDDELRRLLQGQIQLLEDRHHDDFPAQVRSLLHTSLITGQFKADRVAAFFGMHSRTLNRRLNAFGLGFQQLVEETRFEIARQMLEFSAKRDRRDLRVARLRRTRRVHEGISPLERYDAGNVAGGAQPRDRSLARCAHASGRHDPRSE